MNVIIIEDDPDIVESCSLTMSIVWPEIELVSTQLGREGVQMVKREPPDIVILDIGLPDINGFEVLKNIRLFSYVPILVLTVRGDERDIVKALELGADEYITKPFKHMEFIARIKNLLRRRRPSGLLYPIRIGEHSFDPNSSRLFTSEKEMKLTNTESRILLLLKENSGKVVTFNCLADALWETDYPGSRKAIHVYIRRLREKLEADASHPKLIVAKSGIGYFLVEKDNS